MAANGWWGRNRRRLHGAVHVHRRVAATTIYLGITAASYWAAFFVRFELSWPGDLTRTFLLTLPLLLSIRAACSYGFRLALGRWRFVSPRDLIRLGLALSMGSALFFGVTWTFPFLPRVPRSVLLLEWILSGYLTATVWLTYRLGFEQLRRAERVGRVKRVIMVGAGEAGQILVHEMLRSPLGYRPLAFLDDDPFKWGTRAHGVPVMGAVGQLSDLVRTLEPDEIVVAIPSATPEQLRSIAERCEQTHVPFKILPGIDEVLVGRVDLSYLRDIRLEDLLGREPIQLQLPELALELAGRTVLITGAAGSIGAELARQVALHKPRRLILADIAETPLYFIDLELRGRHPEVEIVPLILDVVDREAVHGAFESFRPNRVFHAAAYKHVPLMETHTRQAVRTNTLGTWHVAEAAGSHRAESFVLISTDKAVQPANVMGATKRVAELVVLHLTKRYSRTHYGAVRFGNVLGSSGSVLPLFRWQMENNRPLTVTHEDVTRYFMTIPEAVQLVLQASFLSELKGRVAMLEMGSPVRIVELAKDLLRLAGRPYRVGETVVFTGLRPGEKLHEELVAPGESVVRSAIPKVKLLGSVDEGLKSVALRSLLAALEDDDLELALHWFGVSFPFLARTDALTVESGEAAEAGVKAVAEAAGV